MAKAKKKNGAKKSATQKKRQSGRATTRSTAGPGYQFEDLVAAWLMVEMLRGEVIPGINVPGNKLQRQRRRHRDPSVEGLPVCCAPQLFDALVNRSISSLVASRGMIDRC
jgi:hypothetical protein